MPPPQSPRLSGVTILRPEATGPEYARWRRDVKAVFTAKGIWGHCDGSSPMPMPEAGPNFFSPAQPTNLQPGLLQERKAWVKMDRDVKLDLFLSISDDIKLEVFEVGPPLPPVSMTAQQMMEALDDQFAGFKFEDYHHVFCHFLNLHIDQYANIEDFNAEFQATLDDLLDHGHPMSNIQACSAYFSKLRCTQNPWVAQKLKEWDGQELETPLAHLMQQSPPWSIIRPLNANKSHTSSHDSFPVSIPEEHLEDTPPPSENEYTPSEHSNASTSSKSSSSYSQRQQFGHTRDMSVMTTRSQEITIHASFEDLSELGAFPSIAQQETPHIPKRVSSKSRLNVGIAPPTPFNRPLPPLPPSERSRSTSPKPSLANSIDSAKTGTSGKRIQLPVLTQLNSLPGMEATHPALRSPNPQSHIVLGPDQSNIHPALRKPSTPPPAHRPTALNTPPTTPPAIVTTVFNLSSSSSTRIHSAMCSHTASSSSISSAQSPNLTLMSTPSISLFPSPPTSTPGFELQRPSTSNSAIPTPPPLLRISSGSSSVISLPLQGFSPDSPETPEFKDTLITESNSVGAPTTPPPSKPMSRIEFAKLKFEGLANGNQPRGLSPPMMISEEEKKNRKRSWSIKARLSARHGVREII